MFTINLSIIAMNTPHYELRLLLNRISIPLLKEFFETQAIKYKLGLGVDWNQLTKKKKEPLLELFFSWEQKARETINSTLYYVNLIGSNKRNVLVIASALEQDGVEFPEGFADYSATEMAMWAYLHGSAFTWKDIVTFAQINQYSKRDWFTMKVDAPLGAEPENNEACLTALRDGICKFVHRSEMRGKYGKCSVFPRPDTQKYYYVIYMNDHVINKTLWTGEDHFEEAVSNEAFEVDFMYDSLKHEIHVRAEQAPKVREEFCAIWAKSLMGARNVQKRVKDTYNLQDFLTAAKAVLKTPQPSNITKGTVVSFTVSRYNNKRSRRTYEEMDNLYETIFPELNVAAESLPDLRVERVGIRIDYRDVTGQFRRTTLTIGRNTCNYLSLAEELRVPLHDFMTANGIINEN